MGFRANDVVFDRQSGEEFIAAADEREGEVIRADDRRVPVGELLLVRVTMDDNRIARLLQIAETGAPNSARWAREDLARDGIAAPAARQGSLF